MEFRFRRDGGLGERDFLPLFKRRQAVVRQFQHAEFLRRLPEKTETHEFTADGGPFRAAVLLADAVGGKLRVIPFADFFRVRAGQDFDHVVQADAEALFLADAIDAGEKFLRGERAVERGAR